MFVSNKNYCCFLKCVCVLQPSLLLTIFNKRKEAKYGIPKELKNGSLQISDGYLNDIYRGKTDVFARQFTIMYDRHLFIDFLQPIENSQVGIFVKSNDLVEGFDIEVFFRPFETWTWMAVTLSSLGGIQKLRGQKWVGSL